MDNILEESRIDTLAIRASAHSIPRKLPPAKLYLDDIVHIWEILTESSKDCYTTIVAGSTKCDTPDDLPGIGGRTTHFVMDISSPGKHQTLEITASSTRMHIHEMGDQLKAWSKYANVAAIFQTRKLRLKSAVRTAGAWICVSLWLITVAAWMFLPHTPKRFTIYTLTHLLTGFALAGVIVYYFLSSHSIVYLRHPHRVGILRWLGDHRPEILVAIGGALVGVLAARSLEKGLAAVTLHITQLALR
jgi:hypothetical protein